MLPAIDLRLQNLAKALQEVILPSIPPRESLARDQAMLVIAHLNVIAIQWQSVALFEAGSLDEISVLLSNLVACGDADIPDGLRSEARDALRDAAALDRKSHDAVKAALLRLGSLADLMIAGQGAPAPLSESIKTAVLDYGERQSLRDRVWFAAHNLDPDQQELPSLETVLR